MSEQQLLIIGSKGLVQFKDDSKQKIEKFFIDGDYVKAILKETDEEASKLIPDVTTTKGRNAITANVTKIRNKKVFTEKCGKDLSAELKARPGKVDLTRRKCNAGFEELINKYMQPLEKWRTEQEIIKENKRLALKAEEERKQKELQDKIDLLEKEKLERDKADKIIADELAAKELAAKQKKQQEERDENIRLYAIAEQKKKEENDRIALEAKNKAILDKAAKDKQDAIDAKVKADKALIDAENSRKQQAADAEIAAEKAAADKIENARLAENKRLVDVENARLAQVKRQVDADAKIESDRVAREANINHRKKYNNEALNSLVDNGIDKEIAMELIKLVAKNQVPHMTFNY